MLYRVAPAFCEEVNGVAWRLKIERVMSSGWKPGTGKAGEEEYRARRESANARIATGA